MPRCASGFFMKVSQTKPVRAFSAMSMVMPSIDANHVAVIPVLERIERIDKSITAPGLGRNDLLCCGARASPAGAEKAANPRRRSEPRFHQLAPSSAATPDHVALLRIRSGDAPEIVAVIGKLLAQFQAESSMDISGDHRVLKIIGVLVALSAEIKPRLRILVDE